MSQDLWRCIEASDSIGFNNWMLHEFVPTYYMKESKSNYGAHPEFRRLMRAKQEQYSDVPFKLRGFKDGGRADMFGPDDFPAEFRPNVFMPLHMDIPARTEEELRRFLRLWRRLGLHRWRDVYLSCRASLSTLIYLGAIHGYQQIVLCGIDLNDGRYFWESWDHDPPLYDLAPKAAEGQTHKTLSPDFGIPIDSVVKAMRDEVLAPLGVELTVASETSALASFLPIYKPRLA